MASGPLYFRTPHIEEIPIANTRQAPGFAWVAVAKNAVDPEKAQLEISGKKRARNAGAVPSEAQKDVVSNRRQREVERRIRELNSDDSKDVKIPGAKKAEANVKVGKTSNTKKILASGKEFKHYLDDEEAELARTGKVDGIEREEQPAQRASKMPLARRKTQEDVEMVNASASTIPALSQNVEDDPTLDDFDAIPPFPSADVVQALLDAPPLTYRAASQMPSYAPLAPPRTFCEICGYFGRFRCLKCGAKTCSVDCEAIHVADRCLKFYA